MNRRHGLDADSYKRIVIDSGAVYLDYDEATEAILGATRGGNTFTIATEYRQMEVDGAKGPVVGDKRITGVVATLTANFIEISSDIIKYALPGSDVTTTQAGPTWDTITRSIEIATTDHLTNVAILGEVNGESDPIVLILSNALAVSPFEMAFVDNEETVITVIFTGHFAAAALDTEPWEIRFPKIA